MLLNVKVSDLTLCYWIYVPSAPEYWLWTWNHFVALPNPDEQIYPTFHLRFTHKLLCEKNHYNGPCSCWPPTFMSPSSQPLYQRNVLPTQFFCVCLILIFVNKESWLLTWWWKDNIIYSGKTNAHNLATGLRSCTSTQCIHNTIIYGSCSMPYQIGVLQYQLGDFLYWVCQGLSS